MLYADGPQFRSPDGLLYTDRLTAVFKGEVLKVPIQRLQEVWSKVPGDCDSGAISIANPLHTGYLLSLYNVHPFMSCHLSKRQDCVCLLLRTEMILCC